MLSGEAANTNFVVWFDPTGTILKADTLRTRYDYNLTIMKSPKPATDNRFK